MTDLFADFGRHELPAMVAAALDILASYADDEAARRTILAPWAWDLRQRARQLESAGSRMAANQAKAIARVVSAAALGEVSSDELARAAELLAVDEQARLTALGILRVAMRS